jgi:invasion protein IalB
MTRIGSGARVSALIAALALLMAGGDAMAETKAPKKGEPKHPQQQPAPPAAPAPQPQAAPLPPIVYSPWTKVCPKQPPNAPAIKPVCLTLKEGRLETGQFVAGAAVIEQQGEERRMLRITMPLGLQLAPGTRLTLDTEQPASAPYVVCVPNGCMADYQVDVAFVGKLKKGHQILLQGVDQTNQVVSIPLPLTEFAKAIDGPPTDPEAFEAQQKAEWEKRLKDRKAQQPPAPPKQ